MGVVPFLILLFYSPELFILVFGEKWRQAGEFSQILSFLFFIQFVVSPLSSLILIAEKQKIDFYLQIYLVATVGISLLLGFWLDGIKLALIF